MIDPLELSAEDFLNEIRIAPKWNIFQYYQGGYFDLFVFYPFGTHIFRSPPMNTLFEPLRKHFYRELMDTIAVPSIREAKVS